MRKDGLKCKSRRRRALRFFLGLGYVLLLTALLLYQAGAFGSRRNWALANLGTLLLGVTLAVVLALYVRVNDQIRNESAARGQSEEQEAGMRSRSGSQEAGVCDQSEHGEAGIECLRKFGKAGSADAEKLSEEKKADQVEQKAATGKRLQQGVAENRSYEEIYADFLYTCEGRGLSERELEVAWLIYRGHTNRQIGEELFIAETTVKKHVSHIYQKLGVYSRKEFRAMVHSGALSQSSPVG